MAFQIENLKDFYLWQNCWNKVPVKLTTPQNDYLPYSIFEKAIESEKL